jgi:lipid II:glycine glycyltransferase (peptidoglycan interpeptide bridge formation enzyme)
LSYRAAYVLNNFGYDMLAGTSLEGRKCYASHVATHGLLFTLAEQGCQTYDFGGVDKHSNLGVFNFKHGAGGLEHSYVGEFQTAFPRTVLSLFERMMRFNQARRQAPQLAGSND